MWYTEEEILYEIAHARNPYQQVKVLAELNGVDRATIERILKKHDVPLPKYQRDIGHYAADKVGRPTVKSDKAERRRAEKRRYYLENRDRLLKQAKDYHKRRKERERHGKERQKERDS